MPSALPCRVCVHQAPRLPCPACALPTRLSFKRLLTEALDVAPHDASQSLQIVQIVSVEEQTRRRLAV